MVNLVASNNVGSKKNLLGLFCNVEEAKGYAQAKVNELGLSEQLFWKEIPEGLPLRELFMTGSLLPVTVLKANYADSCLIILGYGF